MPHDQFEHPNQTTRRGGGGRMVAAGVVGACALGAGLGLWARPSSHERGIAAPIPPRQAEAQLAAHRRLEIIVDDTPAPIGQLLEVLPAGVPTAPPPQPPAIEPLAPTTPPMGLMKVTAPLPVVTPAPEPEPKPVAGPRKAKIKPAHAEKAPAKVAKADKPKKAKATKLAKAEKTQKTSAKKTASKTEKARLAKATKPDRKAGKAIEAKKPTRLARVVKAVKTAPKKLKPEASKVEARKKRDAQLAEARETKRAAKAKAAAEKRRAKAPEPPVEKASTPKARKPVPRGEGPMRVARADACVSSDPGEALVCADPRLGQRDRQLQRAFRDAEAAGVPASALRRQQERWLASRAAAARDGSWAVEDVYEARIAELNDLARDARDD